MNSEAGPKGEGQDARSKREVTKRKDPSLPRFAGIVPAKSAVGLRSLSTTHRATAPCVASTPASMPSPVLTPNWPASVPATLRAVPPPTRHFRGAPGRAAGLLARTWWKAEAKSRSGYCSGFSEKYAQEARCSTRGPCAAVRDGRPARRGIGRDADPFSPGQEPGRKTRPALTDLLGGSPASAKRGGLSLWLPFSLATQRESNSGARGARKLFALDAKNQQEHRPRAGSYKNLRAESSSP
jgi:hypothetical protein